MKARLLTINLIGIALLAAAWFSGALGMLLSIDRVHASAVVGTVVLIGLGYAWAGKWGTVFWIKESLPFLGLLGTTFGAILVVPEFKTMGADETAHWHVAGELIGALVSNLIAVAGYGWLRLVRRVCEPRHATD